MRWGIAMLLVATGAGCDQVFTVEVPDGACPAIFGVDQYKFFAAPESWLTAQVRCAQLDDDPTDLTYMHLVVLGDELEARSLRLPPDYVEAWIGLTDRVVRDDWRWVTDEPIAAILWGDTEPDDTSTQRCGRLDGADLKIHDSGCNDLKPYICECDGFPVDTTHIE